MQWVILIGNETLDINAVHAIEHFGKNTVFEIHSNRFSVDFGKEHVIYEYVEDLISDYDSQDLTNIPYENPRFIMMIYSTEAVMKRILSQDNFLRNIYIDDDHGNILPIEDFILSFKPD